MNNMMNKYYIFDRLELHDWLTESTDFSKTYINVKKILGLKIKLVGLNITKYKEDGYVTVISGIIKDENTIFDLYDTNICQKINRNEYNDIKSKISKCLLEEFKHEKSDLVVDECGLWWENMEMYKIPNLIFDTVMQ